MGIIDIKAFGHMVRQAREQENMTRKQLCEEIHICYRHIQAIENYGKSPSLSVFLTLCRRFNISVDQFLFPETNVQKTTLRRHVENRLDQLQEDDLTVIDSTVDGLLKIKKP